MEFNNADKAIHDFQVVLSKSFVFSRTAFDRSGTAEELSCVLLVAIVRVNLNVTMVHEFCVVKYGLKVIQR